MIYCYNEHTCCCKREVKGKQKGKAKIQHRNGCRKKERGGEDKDEDMLGRLNVVWGYTVIKTSRLESFSAPARAADTNSKGIKSKP